MIHHQDPRRALLVDLNPEYLDQQLRRAVDRPLGL